MPAGGSCPAQRLAPERDPHGEGAPLCVSVLRQRAATALQVVKALNQGNFTKGGSRERPRVQCAGSKTGGEERE